MECHLEDWMEYHMEDRMKDWIRYCIHCKCDFHDLFRYDHWSLITSVEVMN
jgi:hypothetical protein